MAGFGNAFDKIGSFGKSIVNGTQKMGKEISLGADIDLLEKKVLRIYQQLGDKYYALHGNEPEDAFKEYCDEIKALKDEIAEKHNDIIELKGQKKCPHCGAAVDGVASFCASCGKSMAVVQTEEPAGDTAEPAAHFCGKCGSMVSEGAVFCGTCGEKLS